MKITLRIFGVLLLLVVLGRFVYGWALFQSMVRLDALLFQFSTPDSYSLEFSKANLFQGLGVLFASLSAGSLVAQFGAQVTFVLAAGGFVSAVLLYALLFRSDLFATSDGSEQVRADLTPDP